MTMLLAASVFFLAIHLLVSGTFIRGVIVGAIGEGPYMGAFSLASVAGIVWLAISYNGATAEGSEQLWNLGPAVTHMGIPVIALAFLLGVSGLLTPNPTSIGMESVAARPEAVSGVLRITRHPFLWGVAIWSAFHLAANGDAASVLFFGTFLALALLGTVAIDGKRSVKMGEAWVPFAKATSNVPFLAILMGRNSLRLGELISVRQLAALAVFLGVLFFHARLFGVSPFPGGWVPF
jgi:uncharacterized membrane protein